MKQLRLLVLSLFIVFSCSKLTDYFPGEIGLWVLDEITAEELTPAMEDDLYEYKNLSWAEFLDEKSTYEGYKKLKINDGIDFRNQQYNPTANLVIKSNIVWKRDGEKIYIKDFIENQTYVFYIVGKNLRIIRNSNGTSYYWLRKK